MALRAYLSTFEQVFGREGHPRRPNSSCELNLRDALGYTVRGISRNTCSVFSIARRSIPPQVLPPSCIHAAPFQSIQPACPRATQDDSRHLSLFYRPAGFVESVARRTKRIGAPGLSKSCVYVTTATTNGRDHEKLQNHVSRKNLKTHK